MYSIGMPMTRILAFYAFSPLDEERLPTVREQLFEFGRLHDMRGLVLLATEGINGTVCGSDEAIGEWRAMIGKNFPGATWNESAAAEHVFPRWLVKVREEIVALDRPDSAPLAGTHLTPEEWNEHMKEDDTVVIDTRNTYETTLGMFDGAIDPAIKHFRDFPAFAQSCDIEKEKKVLLYCTGGIRCEKAVAAMKDAGYKNVFQLKGGILAYLKAFPSERFKGECFVFDHRVAVDQHLQPSTTYSLCPACGDPGTVPSICSHCSAECILCADCLRKGVPVTCDKNCRYHHLKQAQKSL